MIHDVSQPKLETYFCTSVLAKTLSRLLALERGR